ncbi:MAG TPA: hypothetical protein DCS66_18610, partial [Flavobacteriaceae bacterium]|nr:hypothetical protein [Flavobacteriaceae bacterium]
LYDVSAWMGQSHKHYHSAKIFNHDINKEIASEKLDWISYTNAEYETVKKIEGPFKGFHVIRDPRDIVVSSYFSHLETHSDYMWPELNDYRAELKSLDINEGIYATMRHLEAMKIDGEPVPIFDCMGNWNYNNKDILEIRFEDITRNPFIEIPIIFDHLGLLATSWKSVPNSSIKQPIREAISRLKVRKFDGKRETIPLETLLYFIYKHDFYFKSKGRDKGKNDVKSHYRKGTSGDWKNYFTEEHKKHFKERYGDLLIQLGYEANNDW